MDALFVATHSESEIAAALELWPELAAKRIRPLLVTAFGDIFVEAIDGEVTVIDPLELSCDLVAASVSEFHSLFRDPEWAAERLLTQLLYLANERGITRQPGQVFSIAPHPCFTGNVLVEHLLPMALVPWHHICAQLRTGQPTAGELAVAAGFGPPRFRLA